MTGEILRGSLLERTVFRHKANCEKCASGEAPIQPARRADRWVDGLDEQWMVHADEVLADEKIVMAAYEALAKRRRLSRTRGRRGYSAEVVVRLLILKHARNWSYAVLEREVRANLIYRKFTRIGFAKMAGAKTMGKWGLAVGRMLSSRSTSES